MRRTVAETDELNWLVTGSDLPARQTWRELRLNWSPLDRWDQRDLQQGQAAHGS